MAIVRIVEFEYLAGALVVIAGIGAITTLTHGLDPVSASLGFVWIPAAYFLASRRLASRRRAPADNPLDRNDFMVATRRQTLSRVMCLNSPLLAFAVAGLASPIVGAITAGGCVGYAIKIVLVRARLKNKEHEDGVASLRLFEGRSVFSSHRVVTVPLDLLRDPD